jgi:peptide/nickel transport system substrate-binding protein
VGHRTTRRVFGGGLGAAALLGGAAPAPVAAQIGGDELRVIGFEIFYGMDPVHEFSPSYLRSVGAAEGLLRATPTGDVEGDLARGYEPVDATTWRVHLRPQVTFWSGKPVDSAAVLESLERSRQLAPPAATLLRGIRIEAEDEWSVLFRADAPIPGLPLILADGWLMIHNAASYGPSDNSYDLGAVDLTGFYRITGLTPRSVATLERNERYWGVPPRMRRVRFQEIADIDARSLAALSGEAHLVRQVSSTVAGQLERHRTMRLDSVAATSTTSVYLNLQRPPFDDARVRQALAWAVDREELIALAFDTRGAPLPSWLASNPAYAEAKRTGYTRVDLQKAAQLLDEAGWRLAPSGRVRMKDGKPLAFRLLWFGSNRPVVEVLQAQWARVGALVEVEGAPDYGIVQQRRAQNEWEALVEGWGTFGEPATVLARHVAQEGDLNYGKFRDPQTEQLMDGFAALLDPEERRQQALKVNQRVTELAPFIPLYLRYRLNGVSRGLRNYVSHFDQFQEVHHDLWVGA